MLDELIFEFGIPGAVAFVPGQNGLPKAILTHQSGASAEVYLHGAHVTSWRVVGGEDLFFLSEESLYEQGRPIRGGIPVIFPQFGGGALPSHGFARLYEWEPVLSAVEENGDVEFVLHLEETSGTHNLWPHPFRLELAVTLSERALAVRMTVENSGAGPFSFTEALHTYFSVSDIRRVAVRGLQGGTYIDTLREDITEVEAGDAITFAEETDRIYVAAPDTVSVEDDGRRRTVTIQKHNMPDIVVWNPWTAKSQRMPDFGDTEYLRMVCVETGHMAAPHDLPAGGTWQGSTLFTVS
jgi:glucose-6-phosphate 1-epimerase